MNDDPMKPISPPPNAERRITGRDHALDDSRVGIIGPGPTSAPPRYEQPRDGSR